MERKVLMEAAIGRMNKFAMSYATDIFIPPSSGITYWPLLSVSKGKFAIKTKNTKVAWRSKAGVKFFIVQIK